MKKAKEFKNTQNKNAFENFSTALKTQSTADKLHDIATRANTAKRPIDAQIAASELRRKEGIVNLIKYKRGKLQLQIHRKKED